MEIHLDAVIFVNAGKSHCPDGVVDTFNASQPDYLNPLGRTVRLSIRKLFY